MFELFTTFDWLIVVIVLLSGATGLMRGFCSEATSLFGWILAFWVMLKHSDKIDFLLKASIPQSNVRMVITSFLVFLGILIIAKITGLILKTFVSMIGLGPFDRFLGMIIGFARGFLLAGLLLIGLDFFNIVGEVLLTINAIASGIIPGHNLHLASKRSSSSKLSLVNTAPI